MIVTRIWPQYLSGLLWSLSYFSLILTVLGGGGGGNDFRNSCTAVTPAISCLIPISSSESLLRFCPASHNGVSISKGVGSITGRVIRFKQLNSCHKQYLTSKERRTQTLSKAS